MKKAERDESCAGVLQQESTRGADSASTCVPGFPLVKSSVDLVCSDLWGGMFGARQRGVSSGQDGYRAEAEQSQDQKW